MLGQRVRVREERRWVLGAKASTSPTGAPAPNPATTKSWSCAACRSSSAARRRLSDVGMHAQSRRDRGAARRKRRRQIHADQDPRRASIRSIRATVTFRGRDVTAPSRRLPIAFIHQDLGLIDWMTVAENICLTLGFPAALRHDRLGRGAPAGGGRAWKRSAPTSTPTCASRA